jgi:hypothetical protein
MRAATSRTVIVAGALAAFAIGGRTAVANPAAAAPSSGLVVNEVYGGSDNTGAMLKNVFIEVANRLTAALASTAGRWSTSRLPLARRQRGGSPPGPDRSPQDVVHVNAGYTDQTRDHDRQVVDITA